MTLPIENSIAAFPPCVKAGRVTLHALTIGDVISLSVRGVDVTKTPVQNDKIFETAFVLSGETDYRSFLRMAKCGLKQLSDAVEEVFDQAFLTRIPPHQENGDVIQMNPSGLGWPLELAESLCAEYGWSFDAALGTPLCRAFALQAVSRIRNGGKHGGPDYIERTLDIVKNSIH